MAGDTHLPTEIDPDRPSAARIYDAFLGGDHNFAADRAVADRAVELVPDLPRIVRANRAFLRRAVRFAADRGVRQFLDLGSGIPAEGAVHEVARAVRPDARIAYVDREPTAVLHAREVVGADPGTVIVHGDLRRPGEILADPGLAALIDLSEPVCLLMLAVLHFLQDGPELTATLAGYRDAAVPGSVLAVSHVTAGTRSGQVDRISDLYNRTGTPLVVRDGEQLAALLRGWEPVEPGVVYAPQWRPEPADGWTGDPGDSLSLAVVGLRA
ncbi:hypothetical protein Asp14428_11080 [Actinoplanes sp. NBRC 14428]|uniref:S-adenosyl methyltransferase n=1 Tax=Pseudosporangium ferrugineum TaxID=439699 RepID=A0A2T0SFD9_9ACTN|nr:SAM-dependent methyltransferase [Pseudosporangium ferrugineum]PRY32124.1 S-adenosyl methyltransferase [Pseudosporangium ferrugineum]BCJ49633.1 hypothetical protein Asp14428_11080 [Actinoplanes sp. NBRC 14428]